MEKASVRAGVIRWAVLAAAVLVLVALDQWTKVLALRHLAGHTSVDVIPGWIRLTYVENRGAAFGIFQGRSFILGIFSTIAAILIIWLYGRIPVGKDTVLARICLILILAGAIGNQLDRLIRTFVVDMIEYYLFSFPVFNVADMMIVIGGILMIVLAFFFPKQLESMIGNKEKKTADKPDAASEAAPEGAREAEIQEAGDDSSHG